MQLGSEPWIPDKQILEICHCRSETILLTPNSSCEASVPVIFITAYPERFLTGTPPEPAFLIAKPFGIDSLKAVISQALFFDRKAHRAVLCGAPGAWSTGRRRHVP
jgi:hypothetical protein